MLIRSISIQEEMNDGIIDESNVINFNRNFYIHDCGPSPFSDGTMRGMVTQVNKALVRGIPYDNKNKLDFDRPEKDRVTLVKSIYIYDAIFYCTNHPELHFRDAYLKLIKVIVTGLTDTEIIVNDMIQDECKFLISLFDAQQKILTNMTSVASEPVSRNNILSKIFQLDIPDPRYNKISLLDRKNKDIRHNSAYELECSFRGEELLRHNTKIHLYQHDVNSESVSDTICNYLISGNGALTSMEDITRKYINEQISVKNLLVDMLKVHLQSMFESFILTYDSTDGINIHKMVFPFKSPENIHLLEIYMKLIKLDFEKYCIKMEEQHGNIRVLLNVHDVEHYAIVIFKNTNHVVKYKLSKQECIDQFLFERVSSANEIEDFKYQHELNYINFFAKRNDDGLIEREFDREDL